MALRHKIRRRGREGNIPTVVDGIRFDSKKEARYYISLNEEPILQPDGSLENVFVYNGNAWRGQLRDLAASDMLERLDKRLPIESFHLLFSGGKLGGEMKVDVNLLKQARSSVPMLALGAVKDSPSLGHFNSFGLSPEATVPWF